MNHLFEYLKSAAEHNRILTLEDGELTQDEADQIIFLWNKHKEIASDRRKTFIDGHIDKILSRVVKQNNQENKLNLADSTQQAHIIFMVGMAIEQLDPVYLKVALQQMRDNHSFKESASILSPNPHTIFQKLDVEALKLKQLDLMLQLRENMDAIAAANVELKRAEKSSNALKEIFG